MLAITASDVELGGHGFVYAVTQVFCLRLLWFRLPNNGETVSQHYLASGEGVVFGGVLLCVCLSCLSVRSKISKLDIALIL